MQILVRFLEKSFLDSQYNALGGIQARPVATPVLRAASAARRIGEAIHGDR
jgi:hypothetical protein